jgi:hypothetical protein
MSAAASAALGERVPLGADPGLLADPYRIWDELRSERPVWRLDTTDPTPPTIRECGRSCSR